MLQLVRQRRMLRSTWVISVVSITAMVSTVRLPKTKAPDFPKLCVACNAVAPRASVRMFTSAIGWWTALFAFGAIHRVDIPACQVCARRLWWTRLFRFLVTVLCISVGVGIADHLTRGMRWRKLICLGGALLALLPWLVWQAIFPAAVDMTAYEKTIDYEFRDRDYAEEFAALNGGKVE